MVAKDLWAEFALIGLLLCLERCTALSFRPAPPRARCTDVARYNVARCTNDNFEHAESSRWHRRNFLTVPLLVASASPFTAVAVTPLPRDVDVGGGFDLFGSPRLAENDVVYPISMEGPWLCSQAVTQMDGDSFQAKSAWRVLGGDDLRLDKVESFPTRFIRLDVVGESAGVVKDRGFEISARRKIPDVLWSASNPDVLEYDKIRIAVVRRSVEPPSDQGFGFNELYRIDDGLVTRAVQVKRRYRRAFDANGNRVVEGLEIMKTFRVLDGIAGTEMPTSTTKSQLRLTRQ